MEMWQVGVWSPRLGLTEGSLSLGLVRATWKLVC